MNRKKARRVATVVNGAAYAAIGWGFFYPHPYGLVIFLLGALPLVAVGIAVTGQGRYSLEGRKDDPRPNLVVALILPGLVLMYRALTDEEVLDWRMLLWLTGAIAVAWVALLYTVSPELRERKLTLAIMAPLMAAYGYGACALVDMRLDPHTPVVYDTKVLGKHVTSGRSRTYYLDVEPWGPRSGHGDVSVTRDFYDGASAGSRVCVYLWPGALGARWFETGSCPGT